MSRIITLAKLPEPVEMWELVEAEIIRVFKQEFFLPLIREILPDKSPNTVLRNAIDDLVEAIMTGRISFDRGSFKGQFNASVSRELKRLGAEWDRKTNAYRIREADLPVEVRAMISVSEAKLNRTIRKIDERLRSFNSLEITEKLRLTEIFDRTLYKVDRSFRKNVEKVRVAPTISAEERMEIAWSWKENLNLYIKDFSDKQTLELRNLVEKNAWSGNRRENLIQDIQSRYSVTKNKANFLSRNETNLMMEAWTRSRYQGLNLNEYFWKCVAGSSAHPVRPSHRALGERSAKGETFKWTKPPLLGDNGQMCHPKQDYNCRCWAQVVVKL